MMVQRVGLRASMAAFWRTHPAVLTGFTLLLLCNALLPLVYGSHRLIKVLDYASVFAMAFWATGLAWRRAHQEGPSAFALLGVGAALGGLRYVPTLLACPCAPWAGPLLTILGLLSLGTGFLVWPHQARMPRDRIRNTLDGIALGLSVFTAIWVALGSVEGLGNLSRGMILIYLLQVCTCVSLLALWLLQETHLEHLEQAQAKRFVRGALIFLLCHSVLTPLLRITGTYQQSYLGHGAELLNQLAIVYLALAALSPASLPQPAGELRKPASMRALIPSLAALAVLLLIAFEVFRPGGAVSKPMLGFGLALMATLMLRHGLLILDLEGLSNSLETRIEARTHELEAHHREAVNSVRVRMMAGLAAGLVHDLNNLLGILRLRLGILRETATPEQLEEVTVLQEASERAIAMTRQILMSSRQQEVVPIRLALADWMDSRRALLEATLLPGQSLSLDMEPGLDVFADPRSLDQILQNLISNARDAMGAMGTLLIRARPCSDGVAVAVQDDGPGIPPQHMATLFEPFFTTKPSGTGLGLATVQNLVHQNHGTIQVASTVNQGTTFTLTLPVPPRET